ncbi:MAG TPA: hypothetical protein VF157_05660 [Chloroflexota bacterium]
MNDTMTRERQALLALELTSLGADLRRLGFLKWLRDNGQDPEWSVGLARDESLARSLDL